MTQQLISDWRSFSFDGVTGLPVQQILRDTISGASASQRYMNSLHFATGAQAMIHKPLCMAWGNADDFKEVIKQLDLCEDSILDVYEEHLKEGVTRDKIKSFMAKEKWFSGAELAEYFDVLIDEKAAVAACASDYFEKYNHVPESIKGTATKDIVDAVLAELEKYILQPNPTQPTQMMLFGKYPIVKVSNRTVKSEPVYSPAFTISGSKLAIDGTTTAIDASATSDVTAFHHAGYCFRCVAEHCRDRANRKRDSVQGTRRGI